MYTVYCHTSRTTGKRYIGATSIRPEKRWKNGAAYKTCTRFYEAITTYGWDDFEHEIIKTNLTKEEAHALEIELIEKHHTTDPEYGYNMSTGGRGGRSGIKEDAEATRRRTKNMKGRTITEEHRKKISQALTGIKRSEETRKKISESHKGIRRSDEFRKRMSEVHKGFKMPEEAKQKIRESKRGVMKRVYCFETDTTYESIAAAADALGVNKTNLCATCRGKHKHVGGYHVKYADDGL